MILTVGKTRGFVIEGTPHELRHAASMPGAVWRRGDGVVRMPENLASWKALRDAEFEIVDRSAYKALSALETAYRAHRCRVRNATRRFKLTGETEIPVPLKTIPFQHQVRAFGFCVSLDESALFMDMGTGKTMVAIAIAGHHYLQQDSLRVLVICPKAVKPVWPRELHKHAGFDFCVGMDQPPEGPGAQFWVTNYDRVKREQRRIQKWKPDLIILDESHRIKNRKATRTKAVCSLRSRLRLALTGSPIGKCITEAWSQYNFIKKDVFGSYTSFRDKYLRMGGYMGYKVIGYKNEDEFADKLHSLAFRVTKDECLDLPPLTYQRLYVEPDRNTKKVYSELDLNFFSEVEGEEVSVDREATKQMKLRQIVGGMVRTDGQEVVHVSNLKSDTLGELLEDRANDKTVIFFSFSHEIAIAQKICEKLGMGYLTLQGSTPEKERQVFEDRFQQDLSVKVALIQVQTGAEGMTLTAADVAVFYSPTFSFISYTQARDRINRMGQLRPTTIIFIIMVGTVDERVVDVLESNRQLTDTYMESKRNYTMATKKAPAAPAEKEAPVKTGFTAADLASNLSIEPAELRKHLRALEIEKPADSWTWPNAKAAASVEKAVAARIKELASKPKAEKAPAKEAAPKAAKAAAPKEAEAPKTKPVRKAKPKAE